MGNWIHSVFYCRSLRISNVVYFPIPNSNPGIWLNIPNVRPSDFSSVLYIGNNYRSSIRRHWYNDEILLIIFGLIVPRAMQIVSFISSLILMLIFSIFHCFALFLKELLDMLSIIIRKMQAQLQPEIMLGI